MFVPVSAPSSTLSLANQFSFAMSSGGYFKTLNYIEVRDFGFKLGTLTERVEKKNKFTMHECTDRLIIHEWLGVHEVKLI